MFAAAGHKFRGSPELQEMVLMIIYSLVYLKCLVCITCKSLALKAEASIIQKVLPSVMQKLNEAECNVAECSA